MNIFGYEPRFTFAHWDLLRFWNWQLGCYPINVVTTFEKSKKLKKPYISGKGRSLHILFLIVSFVKAGRWPAKGLVAVY